jgi:hypothetical protein
MPTNVVKTTPRRSDRTARLLTAARLYLNSPPALPEKWGQNNLNVNNYHSDLVLATGPGNPPAVQLLAGGSILFGSLPSQKPHLLCVAGFVARTRHKPAVF